jgi:hypothetical protein
MHSRSAKTLLVLTATAVLALPVVAQARQGADDPAGHLRHDATEIHHHHHHHHANARHAAATARHGADDTPGDQRAADDHPAGQPGADDAPGDV